MGNRGYFMGVSKPCEMDIFREITACPRPSGSLDSIQGYLESFADRNGLVHVKDGVGNIMIQHPGTSSKRIILQAHQDMVPTVASGKEFDFWTQPISTYCKDGWMHADGTTLGADDGTGIAIALYALIADELKDIDLRAIFTVDEEVSMAGAIGIDPSWLDADCLINIDSENEDEVIIGCAGCCVIFCRTVPDISDTDGRWFCASVDGLCGGHSGLEIDQGHANALTVISEFLSTLNGVKISSFSGGSAPNVIPQSVNVVFTADEPDVVRKFDEFSEFVRSKYVSAEPRMALDIKSVSAPEVSWTDDFSLRFIRMLCDCPNGCIEKIGDNVITSSNCAMVFTEGNECILCVMMRSSKEEVLSSMVGDTMAAFSDVGKADVISRFPSWLEERNSWLVNEVLSAYERSGRKKPKVTITHGGLECGEFRRKNPDITMVSVGPTILGAHTPDERLDIGSFQRTRELVFSVVKKVS